MIHDDTLRYDLQCTITETATLDSFVDFLAIYVGWSGFAGVPVAIPLLYGLCLFLIYEFGYVMRLLPHGSNGCTGCLPFRSFI
jgi:hypothetical protein